MVGKKLSVLAVGLAAFGFCAAAQAALVREVRTYWIYGYPQEPHTRDAWVYCLPGEIATGGGYDTNEIFELKIIKSAPITYAPDGRQGWTVRYVSPYGVPTAISMGTIHVICMKEQ